VLRLTYKSEKEKKAGSRQKEGMQGNVKTDFCSKNKMHTKGMTNQKEK